MEFIKAMKCKRLGRQRDKLTALLVGWLYVVTVANESADSCTHSVSVGLLGLFIKEVIWHQAGIALVHYVLKGKSRGRLKSVQTKQEDTV